MALAERVAATIINADSMQVYRDLRVLTARPSVEDEARVPHRLFGYLDGSEACSAARWARDAKAAVASIHAAGRLPILVGGTGLYIRSLLDGIAPVPEVDPIVRADVRALPVAVAHAALTQEDASMAARLAPADTTRVARALEVVRSTGRSLSDWQDAREGGIAPVVDVRGIVVLPPRDRLASRIDARFETMFEDALVEVATLIARRLEPALPVMRAIGVDQLAAHLRGDSDRAGAIAAATLATRQYAKRQATWFGRQVPASWRVLTTFERGDYVRDVETILQTLRLT